MLSCLSSTLRGHPGLLELLLNTCHYHAACLNLGVIEHRGGLVSGHRCGAKQSLFELRLHLKTGLGPRARIATEDRVNGKRP
ncbi:hypothetical protein AFA91_10735 [Mycolicibacterium goodii]|uniref:Uncharacterized protein n=1 Tax=Mycolicibacterium goodii TaxID=134601 RepID=A0A0K0X4G7_MYCGD|nr:hypothetical protein AFA91_10735 [Mycolicibacterium goodii]